MGGYGMAAEMRELTEQNMQEFVKEVEKRKIPLHSVLIAQHGNLLFEKYYAPYCRNKLQRMFSVTKSFTSLAIGLLEQFRECLLVAVEGACIIRKAVFVAELTGKDAGA